MANLSIRKLRLIGLIGLAVVLAVDLIVSLRMRSGFGLGFAMLLLFPLVVGVVSFVVMRRALGTLARWPDLLLPLALVTVAIRIVHWLSALPGLGLLLNPAIPLNLFNTGIAISLRVVLTIILGVFYASWVTGAISEYVSAGRNDLRAQWLPAWRRFWRVLGVETIGNGGVMLVTTLLIQMMPVLGLIVLLPMAAFSLMWNFGTAALLPVVCQCEWGFWRSVREGFSASLKNLSKWWLLLLAQMFLLGLIFFYFSSRPGNTSIKWSVDVFWTGSYEANSRWYGKLAAAFQVGQLPVVQTLLTLLFGVIAVAVKLAIVQRLHSAKRSSE